MSFEDARKWYDGYDFLDIGAIYNPYSVMLSMNPAVLEGYRGEVVIVGIQYDAKRKIHNCLIEKCEL